jgi:hypothetical protein
LNVGLVLGAASLAFRLALGTLSMGPLDACSITATDGGVLIKPQTTYKGSPTMKTSGAWAGRPIVIDNTNGSVTVSGDPNATTVTVSAKPTALADGDKEADATQALADVLNTFTIDESNGQITVRCKQASKQYGSAGIPGTGCELTATVPQGTATQGLALTEHTGNSDVTGSNFYAQGNVQIQVTTDNGKASGTGITGSVKVHSDNGEAVGGVVPTPGSQIEVSTKNGGATLSLPAGFACDALTLSAPSGTVTVASGFTNTVTATSTSVGMGGGAKSVVVSTDLGDVTLQPQ